MMSDGVRDFLVLGSGPAGTSAALALAEAGRRVTLVDAGQGEVAFPPTGSFRDLREHDVRQWEWQLGRDFSALRPLAGTSPKFRVPGLASIFSGYAEANRLRSADGFQMMGALAGGGLSNAWGCGVARFSHHELGVLEHVLPALDASFEHVGRRIGISGASDDALTEYFGVDEMADPAIPMDALHTVLWERRARLTVAGRLRLGRARVAVLNRDRPGRLPCDLSGMCLWGCERRATWSAALDLQQLRRHPRVEVITPLLAHAISREGDLWRIAASAPDGGNTVLHARKLLLATGTIATTRLVLAAMDHPPQSVPLLSNPMAAFLLLLPQMLGVGRERGFGLAQLSYVLEEASGEEAAFGNLFSTAGIPVNEFLRYLPLTRRAGLPLLRALLPASVVGNVFLPGSLSRHTACLDSDGGLTVRAGSDPMLEDVHTHVARRIQRAMRRLGAWMLPGSYVAGAPGADLHYAASLPIRLTPLGHECDLNGEVASLPGLHVVDGASLPQLPAKAHTLTIMANADRIARALAVKA